MKRLTVPLLMCIFLGVGSVAALEDQPEATPQPKPDSIPLNTRIDVLQKQVEKLQTEAARQSELIDRQSELIARLEARLAAQPMPVFVPQSIVPLQRIDVPHPGAPPEPTLVVPQHPSAWMQSLPPGTQARSINGIPFYVIPLGVRQPSVLRYPAAVSPEAPGFKRDALAGALVLPGERQGN